MNCILIVKSLASPHMLESALECAVWRKSVRTVCSNETPELQSWLGRMGLGFSVCAAPLLSIKSQISEIMSREEWRD